MVVDTGTGLDNGIDIDIGTDTDIDIEIGNGMYTEFGIWYLVFWYLVLGTGYFDNWCWY